MSLSSGLLTPAAAEMNQSICSVVAVDADSVSLDDPTPRVVKDKPMPDVEVENLLLLVQTEGSLNQFFTKWAVFWQGVHYYYFVSAMDSIDSCIFLWKDMIDTGDVNWKTVGLKLWKDNTCILEGFQWCSFWAHVRYHREGIGECWRLLERLWRHEGALETLEKTAERCNNHCIAPSFRRTISDSIRTSC